MKLRNKKTGETIDLNEGMISDTYDGEKIEIRSVAKRDNEVYVYSSLAELNAEWEDYEEPKEFYFIDQFMSVSKGVVDDVEYAGRNSAVNYAKKTSNNLKTAGNYFETKEEAKKAVEKLKAWKRLKEAGFEFSGWTHTPITKSLTGYNLHIKAYSDKLADYMDDLELIFGGEE